MPYDSTWSENGDVAVVEGKEVNHSSALQNSASSDWAASGRVIGAESHLRRCHVISKSELVGENVVTIKRGMHTFFAIPVRPDGRFTIRSSSDRASVEVAVVGPGVSSQRDYSISPEDEVFVRLVRLHTVAVRLIDEQTGQGVPPDLIEIREKGRRSSYSVEGVSQVSANSDLAAAYIGAPLRGLSVEQDVLRLSIPTHEPVSKGTRATLEIRVPGFIDREWTGTLERWSASPGAASPVTLLRRIPEFTKVDVKYLRDAGLEEYQGYHYVSEARLWVDDNGPGELRYYFPSADLRTLRTRVRVVPVAQVGREALQLRRGLKPLVPGRRTSVESQSSTVPSGGVQTVSVDIRDVGVLVIPPIDVPEDGRVHIAPGLSSQPVTFRYPARAGMVVDGLAPGTHAVSWWVANKRLAGGDDSDSPFRDVIVRPGINVLEPDAGTQEE